MFLNYVLHHFSVSTLLVESCYVKNHFTHLTDVFGKQTMFYQHHSFFLHLFETFFRIPYKNISATQKFIFIEEKSQINFKIAGMP